MADMVIAARVLLTVLTVDTSVLAVEKAGL